MVPRDPQNCGPSPIQTANFSNRPDARQVLQPWADGTEPRRRVVVALDTGKDNFRHTIYPGYKADRKEAPEDLRCV